MTEFRTTRQIKIMSSPACSPRYLMTIPAGTLVEFVGGRPVVDPADFHKVAGGNAHDMVHYYLWLPRDAVAESSS